MRKYTNEAIIYFHTDIFTIGNILPIRINIEEKLWLNRTEEKMAVVPYLLFFSHLSRSIKICKCSFFPQN
jgi:hypothetical protein